MEFCQFFKKFAIQIANQYPMSCWVICSIRGKKIKVPQMKIGNQPGEINCVQNVRKTLTLWEMLPISHWEIETRIFILGQEAQRYKRLTSMV